MANIQKTAMVTGGSQGIGLTHNEMTYIIL
jgi:NAD(P)-dependent dehydrogenase (short-subunit alcohol dehydrogenase family)